MSLYAIGDLHLSFSAKKPMDIFSGWDHYVERIQDGFSGLKPEDVCVLCGDSSWAMAITALAGPVSNLLIACVALALYGFVCAPLYGTAVGGYILEGIGKTAYLSIALAVFNIIPIPPLDGSKVLFACMDNQRYAWLMRYERFGFLILIALVSTGILTTPLSTATQWVYGRLFSIAQFTFNLVGKIA